MTIPTEPVAIPERVRLLARGAALSCLWANELGGLTFLATAADGEDFVIKWGPRNQETSMRAEAERRLCEGEPVPGWKFVSGRSSRSWRDEEQAADNGKLIAAAVNAIGPLLDYIDELEAKAQAA